MMYGMHFHPLSFGFFSPFSSPLAAGSAVSLSSATDKGQRGLYFLRLGNDSLIIFSLLVARAQFWREREREIYRIKRRREGPTKLKEKFIWTEKRRENLREVSRGSRMRVLKSRRCASESDRKRESWALTVHSLSLSLPTLYLTLSHGGESEIKCMNVQTNQFKWSPCI